MRLSLVLLLCATLHAETRIGRWTRRGVVAGYCAASAVDGWQSTRPGVLELNPVLRGSGGVSVSRMVAVKAVACGGMVLAQRFARGRARVAVDAGTGLALGAQILTDAHNAKTAR